MSVELQTLELLQKSAQTLSVSRVAGGGDLELPVRSNFLRQNMQGGNPMLAVIDEQCGAVVRNQYLPRLVNSPIAPQIPEHRLGNAGIGLGHEIFELQDVRVVE